MATAHPPHSALACIFLLLCSAPMAAQSSPDGGPVLSDGRPLPVAPAVLARNERGATVRATRITTPMTIDGRLDEAVYAHVPVITEFIQQEPRLGDPVSESTTAWVFYDDDNFYVACRCLMADPSQIVANDMRRDSTNLRQNDNFGVFLDTFHDRRNGYLFYISPVGGMFDGATANERTNNADWNTIWNAKVTRTPEGWTAEIAIPFKSLRYQPGREQTWGINLRRTIRGKNEYAYVAPIRPEWGVGGFFRASAAATLVGLEVPTSGKNLEIKPYAVSRLTTDALVRPALSNDLSHDVGVDVKYGVTKSLTADFTYNTDFAQVEVDEAQVNLTRFNLQFPEKRDFFLEGQGIFAFGGVATGGGGDAPTIFYSRRIGLQGSSAVPIGLGARLAGRVGRYSVGALNIGTDRMTSPAVEPTNFTVLRVRRDVLQRSSIGALFTQRSVSRVAPGNNQVFGLDANLALSQNTSLGGYFAQSRTAGLTRDAVSYRANFNYGADRYGIQVDRTVVGDNFNPEVGFLRRSRFRSNYGALRFSPRPQRNGTIRQFVYEANFDYITNNQDQLESRGLTASARMDLQNSDTLGLTYLREHEVLRRPFDPARGITVPAGDYSFQHVRAAWSPGQQHRLSGTVAVDVGQFYDGRRRTASLNARLGITDQLGVEPNISLNWLERLGARDSVRVAGARATYTMTPRMFVAALVQHSSMSRSIATNLRFRWEYQPGSEFFVVYSDGHDTSGSLGSDTLQNRGLVVKINKLVRF
ncbi:MAG: DUF5916 domain-containing protein [Vicinamibacterales bacterium]